MRGTGQSIFFCTNRRGIIPACAGNSKLCVTFFEQVRDHPRVCGEQETLPFLVATMRGSSPRVRGTADTSGNVQVAVGIIPACAGNSSLSRSRLASSRDHPRVCGEQTFLIDFLRYITGSSPRVRGTDTRCASYYNALGIIPACAGNSAILILNMDRHGDHPRVCGEQNGYVGKEVPILGSSPRVRGTGSPYRAYLSIRWDHPRVCGEQGQGKYTFIGEKGSSPRVRGTG